MAEATAAQLNNGITCMPIDILAKKGGNFKPENGKRRYKTSRCLILSAINRINTVYDGLVKHTYENLHKITGVCQGTINSSLKELEAEKKIDCNGESRYSISVDFSDEGYIILYDFLFNEILNVDKRKISKKLSANAAIVLCNIIQHYTNPKAKEKYFIGGDKRTGTFLNVAPGTANGVINELIRTGSVYSHAATRDSKGNIVLCKNKRKGISKAQFTVYEVNSKILNRCKRILKEYAERRAQKLEASKTPNENKNKNGDKTVTKPVKKNKPKTKSLKAYSNARQRAADLKILGELYAEFKLEEEFESENVTTDVRPPTEEI